MSLMDFDQYLRRHLRVIDDDAVAEQHKRETALNLRRSREEYVRRICERGCSRRHVRELSYPPLPTPALDAIHELGRTGIWCLSGGVGCGKTYAAHVWLLEEHPPPTAILLVTAAAFARESRYGDKYERVSRARRVVLDDLGSEYLDKSGSLVTDLDELIDIRWRNEAPLLITTNLTADEFKTRYGSRITDRIRGSGGWYDVSRDSMRVGGRRE